MKKTINREETILCKKVNKSIKITTFKPRDLFTFTKRKIWKT